MENLPCGAYVCENSAHSIMHGSISDFFVNFEIYAVRSPKNSFGKICLGSKKPMIDILSLYCKYVYKIKMCYIFSELIFLMNCLHSAFKLQRFEQHDQAVLKLVNDCRHACRHVCRHVFRPVCRQVCRRICKYCSLMHWRICY